MLKVCDFGIAKVLGDSATCAQTCVGSPYYMSLEQMKGQKYKFDADAWALGIMLYELMALKKPFDAPNAHMLYQVVTRGVREALDEDRYSSELRGIVDELLNKKPERRPSMAQLETKLLLARHNQQLQASRNAHLQRAPPPAPPPRPSRRRPPSRPPPPATADTASAARRGGGRGARCVPTDGLAALWRQAGTPADQCNATLAELRAKLEPLGASEEAAALRGQLVALGKEAASAEEAPSGGGRGGAASRGDVSRARAVVGETARAELPTGIEARQRR